VAVASPSRAAAGQDPTVLDVPYVPQSEALCGGAAAAMVLRYWGQRAAAEDFASLVDRSAEGIATGVLVAALQHRGWQAHAFAGDGALVRHHLASGRPIVALIEVRPGRLHYVVVIGWVERRVFFHDPAVRPGESLDEHVFEARWTATRRWTLLLLPAGAERAANTPTAAAHDAVDRPVSTGGCDEEVARGVEAARAGDFTSAESILTRARTACPASSAPVRELAGIRAVQQRWPEAVALAESATRLDPADRHAWHIVATGRFVRNDADRALAAWNARGEPRVDLIRAEGLTRTRYTVLESAVGLPPGSMLTLERLRLARRRLAELPALSVSRVAYTPLAGGLAHVDVGVVERPLVPSGRWAVTALGVHALTERGIEARISNPTGGGERWDFGYRWWDRRPKLSLGFAAPRVAGLPGVARVEAFWERQTYATDDRAERRRVTVGASDWITRDVRWSVVSGVDSFSGGEASVSRASRGDYLTLAAALERRGFGDRAAALVDGARWWPTGGGDHFGAGRVAVAWRSSATPDVVRASVTAGWHRASGAAPRDLWPGAGTGQGRDALLRAHPLLDDGVLRGGVFGRTLSHASAEMLVPIRTMRPLRVDIAAFSDVARAARPASILHVDVGGGVRVGIPAAAGVLRADVARGLRDGRTTLSVGWQRAWPGW